MEAKSTHELSRDEAAKLLWEEWKYRHEVFWQAIYRYGLVVVAITVFPYLDKTRVDWLTWRIYVLPGLAALIAIFAAWQIWAEYARLRVVTSRLRKVQAEYQPDKLPEKGFGNRLARISVGKGVVVAFLIFAFVVEGLNAWLLSTLIP